MSNPSPGVFVRSVGAVRSGAAAPPALACFMLLALFGVAHPQTVNTTPRPQLLPNVRRYMEKGLKPATGRSGSASMTARALLGKDGATTVEMTTGGFGRRRRGATGQHQQDATETPR